MTPHPTLQWSMGGWGEISQVAFLFMMGQSQTYKRYANLFIQIKAILNSQHSWPLYCHCYGEQDYVFTPSYFLTSDHLLEPSFLLMCTGFLQDKWVQYQQILHLFWYLWYNDYLNQLQIPSHWHTTQPNFTAGRTVTVKDETQSTLETGVSVH